MNKKITLAIALLGLALGTGAVVWLGAGQVGHAVLTLGWRGFVFVVGWQLMLFVVLGVAWWVVCPGVPVWAVIWGRLVREGGENCLPFSEVGGLAFGARAMMLAGVGWPLAAMSSIVDVATEGIGLAPFILVGAVTLLTRRPGSSLTLPVLLGFGLLVLGGIGVFVFRAPLMRLLRAGTARIMKPWVKDAPDQAEDLKRTLDDLFSRHWRVAGAAAIHFLTWCGGGGTVWIVYHLLGAKIGVISALAIESILSTILAVGFLVPGGLGVQELSYVAVGGLFGMPAHISLALSLIRRARDIVIGAPALTLWQVLEARRLASGADR